MLFKNLAANQDISDDEFDKVYPEHIQNISDLHFTSVHVAKEASEYLAEKSPAILDIGAGVGKFCMIGSVWTRSRYVGVEKRSTLCEIANSVISRYRLNDVDILNSNITNIPFKDFRGFYFFNAFHENICTEEAIDLSMKFSPKLYRKYSFFVRDQLDQMPKGTRLVTYHSFLRELPESYVLKHSSHRTHLKYWERR